MFNELIAQMQKTQVDAEDYIENGLLYCGKCHTPKQTRVKYFPEPCPIMCECRKKASEEAELREELAKKKKSIRDLREKAFSDCRSKECTFERDDNACPEVSAKCKLYAENFAEMKKQNTGIIFLGSVGTGKSFYSCCVANALIDKGISVYSASVSQLIRSVGDYGRKEETFKRLAECELLIIDDLGVERSTDYTAEKLFDIIDTRYRSNKPLIVTTNLTPEELRKPKSREYERIYERIIEMCPLSIVVNSGQRRRSIAAKKRQNALEIFG